MVDFAIPGTATLGPDRTRMQDPSDSRYWIVSTLWLQRALNGQRRVAGRTDFLVEDGTSGPATLAAATSQAPTGTPLPAISSRSQMAIAKTFADRLANVPLGPRQGVSVTAGGAVLETPQPSPYAGPEAPPPPAQVIVQTPATSYVLPVALGASALALIWWFTK